MTVTVAVAVGGLFAMGTFLMLRDDLVKVVWGVAIVSQATNISLITMGGVAEGTHELVPILAGHGDGHVPTTADPLVQALVLTAIVISFGMTAFAMVLSYRAYEENETMNVREWAQ
jgi:multicomponent Na+:H+ antiporter subunit C